MTSQSQQFSPLKTLAAQWRVLGLMAVALARQILVMERADPHGALKKLETLEAWLGVAVFMLAGQLASTSAQPAQEDKGHAQHLQAITAALMTLALFVQRLKQRLAARSRGDCLPCTRRTSVRASRSMSGFCKRAAFNDSG